MRWRRNGTRVRAEKRLANSILLSHLKRRARKATDTHTTGHKRGNYIARCRIRLLTVRRPAYTLPGGEPRMSDTIASRAILMFWNEPRMWILLGAARQQGVAKDGETEGARVGEDDARAARVLDRELGLAVLAGDAAWRAW
jgi:hypothetical protein